MSQFDYFIVFAEMRTGSNLLEANLNAYPGLSCLGEAFNPHFVGYPNKNDCLGIDLVKREADPMTLIQAVRENPGSLTGFRFFHDHDPRILNRALPDPRCAKVILTRNPVDSYVSWKIAQATGQWKLTDFRRRKDAKATFDADEFTNYMNELQEFQKFLLNAMQTTGQTPFFVAYEDLKDVAVMNGLARWLGQSDQLDQLDEKLKVQNPAPVSEKVENFDQMEQALARLDRFNLSRTPNFEPRRGPNVPGYLAAAQTPLMYLPVRGEIDDQIAGWLAGLDKVGIDDLIGQFTQKSLRQWKRRHKGHRSFTVVRHPLARAHSVFCDRIVHTGKGSFGEIRRILRNRHKLPIPGKGEDTPYSVDQHQEAFGMFLDFLKANLAGQTSIRIDQTWATQAAVIEGMAGFALPDMIVREEEMPVYLPALAQQVGHPSPIDTPLIATDTPYSLASIYNDELEAKAQDVYQRDYLMFGFGRWQAA